MVERYYGIQHANKQKMQTMATSTFIATENAPISWINPVVALII